MAGSTTKPGDGPSKRSERLDIMMFMIGENKNNQSLNFQLKVIKIGYGSTSKMIAESGLCREPPCKSRGYGHLHL